MPTIPRPCSAPSTTRGRYAYGNQPAIAQWNLARLAEALLPLLRSTTHRAIERATAALDQFTPASSSTGSPACEAKLGLFTAEADDNALVEKLLAWMHRAKADFTNTFARSGTRDTGR